MKILKVKDFTGNDLAVSSEDGKKLLQSIRNDLDKQNPIKLDFEGIELTISAFLNPSIGQLYSYYSQEFIRDNFTVINMNSDDLQILQIVVNEAKRKFSDFPNIPDSNEDLINE